MKEYDVVVCGGGIAGSVAAKFSAVHGFKTLLVEQHKTPRNKPCSGIQFTYFEKLIGEKIPKEKLCTNELYKVKMITPEGTPMDGSLKMLNFWRSTFDHWLNTLAVDAGAVFCDETVLKDFQVREKEKIKEKREKEGKGEGKVNEKWIEVTLQSKNQQEKVKTRYLIGADGSRSYIRKKMRPQDFGRASGATVNYYFVGDSDIDPNTLYMFYNREFCPLMFAWVYMKDDQCVIGTGADKNPLTYAQKFFDHVKEHYHLRGEVVKREGFSSTLQEGVYLGEGNILMTGDAAGLVDLYRGLGMDNAALSGRLAVKAIIQAEKKGCPPIEVYQHLMKRTVRNLENNAQKQAARYATNETLEKSLSPLNLLKGGLYMVVATQINRILPPERMIVLPP
ncbi:MAG: hypothetical protein AYK19_19040 [Theionarchaea archaeon DG-70-1]|nr:MAG: hypothetical protein AYK19_19040 [Theionarchaea archaeon DG-70-1]